MPDNEHEQRMARPRMAAGALFFDSQGRILLVRPSYKPRWDIPGGYVEIGESPLVACTREVQEELGISPEIGPLLVLDWAPSDAEGGQGALCLRWRSATAGADGLDQARRG